MTTLLIFEGNTPDLIRQGKSDALPFVGSFMAIDPGLTLWLANPYAGDMPQDLIDGADAAVFTGSGVDWSTEAPEAAPQRAAMEKVFAAGLPTWGSCNGMQLAAVVLGGSVGASPNGLERGIARDIELTRAGQAHPMMAGKPARFASPCAHRDEVKRLPEGAEVIAGNAHSPVQAMTCESGGVDFWGVQYHPECSARDVAGWFRGRGGDLAETVALLERAEEEAEAAARLGTTPEELALSTRTREMANWLAHVKARKP